MTPELKAALETADAMKATFEKHEFSYDIGQREMKAVDILAAEVRAQAEKRCETCARLIVRMDICAKLGGSEYDVTPDQINHVCGLWKRRGTP